jgi:two-component system phosphate regulon sensor histidine kinase PhoR
MKDSLVFRRMAGALFFGLAAGGAAMLWLGAHAFWIVLAILLVALALLRLVFPYRADIAARDEPGDAQHALLPPLARDMFEQLPAPVMLMDTGQRVLFVNRSMRALVGADAEHKHVSAVLRMPAVLAAIAHTTDSGAPDEAAFMLHVPIERHFQAFTVRVGSRSTALLLHDLTAIRRSEQMRADFVANASHELRTPLAAVSGFIDTLRGHAREDAPAREKFLDIMSVEAARMRRLIDDLLSLSRIEMNEHVPPRGATALGGILREAAAALAPLAAADGITLEVSVPDELPPVTGERDELIQLFQNLIHNAIKYGRSGGHVWISAPREADSMIAVAIRDDGEGIPPTAIPRLTERFYRVDVKRSREKGGTGLGLAIVKHIVSRHKGRLQIESRAAEGSIFTVFLPAAPAIAPAVMEML